jgi:hypothetical protein
MPVPGRQCRQRLLTLMLDEEIMAPSWPVAWSQAAIDKVISLSLAVVGIDSMLVTRAVYEYT